MGSDQRDADRVPMLGDLRGEMMIFQPLTVREISRDGATIDTTYPLQLNSLHELRLTLGDRSVVVKGRVVHSRISDVDQELVTYRSGVEFVEASDRVAEAIATFLDTIRASRGGVPQV